MDKQIIIDGVNIKDCKRRIGKDNFCRYYKRPCAENNYNCIWKKYLRKEQEVQQAMDNYVQLDLQRVKEYNELVDLYKAKEQECEELKEKVKKYGEINEQETKDYAELKAENEKLIRRITKIFACLINANRTNKIVDTIWVDSITTLWDYIALTLGLEGDQTQVEEQILQKTSKCEVNNDR